MGKISKKLAALIAGLAITFAFIIVPSVPAFASDSVSVPGQVGVDQCPAGYQYSTGISIDTSNNVVTTICNAPPTDAELVVRQQDADFRAAIDAAQAAAEVQSRAWNEANPGQQKCVQWGPIVHANGVSTSSGGVCANPVPLGQGASTPSLDADDVVATTPVLTPNQNIVGNGQPFYKEVSGQVGIEGCPAGYQGANGLVVNAGTGTVTTQCWTTEAWTAWRLGGTVWEKYQATGGGYDITAELDRREKLAALVAQAKTVAQAAADSTPGVRRCSNWTGYGETGQECAYTFVNPNNATPGSTTPTTGSQDVVDPTTLQAPELIVAQSLSVLKTAKATTTVKSLTPKVCKVNALKVKSIKTGTCTYAVTVKNSKGKKSTVKKSVVFVR